MLLGISVMLLGIYMKVEPGIDQKLYGYESFVFLLGLIVVIIGFFTLDRD